MKFQVLYFLLGIKKRHENNFFLLDAKGFQNNACSHLLFSKITKFPSNDGIKRQWFLAHWTVIMSGNVVLRKIHLGMLCVNLDCNYIERKTSLFLQKAMGNS